MKKKKSIVFLFFFPSPKKSPFLLDLVAINLCTILFANNLHHLDDNIKHQSPRPPSSHRNNVKNVSVLPPPFQDDGILQDFVEVEIIQGDLIEWGEIVLVVDIRQHRGIGTL